MRVKKFIDSPGTALSRHLQITPPLDIGHPAVDGGRLERRDTKQIVNDLRREYFTDRRTRACRLDRFVERARHRRDVAPMIAVAFARRRQARAYGLCRAVRHPAMPRMRRTD